MNKEIPSIYQEAIKAAAYVDRAVHKACRPDWDWEKIEKKGIRYPWQTTTLAKLLIAFYKDDLDIAIDNLGYFYENLAGRRGKEIDCESINIKWDLDKDFKDQAPEVQISIAKLLGYNE